MDAVYSGLNKQGQDMRQAKKVLLAVLLLTMVASAKKRDPLTDAETGQLRAVAAEPGKRLALYIKFAESRLVAIDQLRSDPKPAEGRGKKIHDILEDFTAILDEINDNLDTYQGRPLNNDDRSAFRQQLKAVIEASDKFDVKLRALKSAAETDSQIKKEAVDFQNVLHDPAAARKSSAAKAPR